MIPLTQGAATRRVGTQRVDSDINRSLTEGRTITFSRSNALGYTLQFVTNTIIIFQNGQEVKVDGTTGFDAWDSTKSYIPGDWVTDGGEAYYCNTANINIPTSNSNYWSKDAYYHIFSPYSIQDAFKIKFIQSVDTMYLVHPDYPVYKLISIGSADFKLEEVDFVYQALKDENIETDQKMWVEGRVLGVTTSAADWINNLNYAKYATVVFDDGSGDAVYQALRDINEYEDYIDPSAYPTIWVNLGIATAVSTRGSLVYLKSEGGREFTSDDVGKYWLIKKPREDTSVSDRLNALGDVTAPTLSVKGEWKLITHGTWTGTIELQRSYDGGTTWVLHRTYSSVNDNNVKDDGEEESLDVLYRVEMTDYTSGSVTVDLSVEDPYNLILYKAVDYIDTNTLVVQLTEDEDNSRFNAGSPEKYSSWAEGAWGGGNGYPRSIALFQERLCFGGNYDQGLTVWLSKIADYENLTSGVLDTSALIYTLASDKANEIVWMMPHDKLLIGTTGDEWVLGSGKTGEPMSPVNTTARRQSTYGSEDIQAIAVNNVVFFVQRGGRKIREMAYDYQTELYQSPDMTVMSEHITKPEAVDSYYEDISVFDGQYGIVSIQFQLNPFPILWALRSDGVLLGFTYEREQEVYGWHRHPSDGFISSINVVPGAIRDRLWINAKRRSGHWSVERFFEMEIPTVNTSYLYLDGAIQIDLGINNTVYKVNDAGKWKFYFETTHIPLVLQAHGYETGDHIKVSRSAAFPNTAVDYEDEIFIVEKIDDVYFYLKNISNTSYVGLSNFPNIGDTITDFAKVQKRFYSYFFNSPDTMAIAAEGYFQTGLSVQYDGASTPWFYVEADEWLNNVYIGYNYNSILKPMNIETELADGGSQGRVKRISRAVIRFYNSVGATVISDEGNTMLVPFLKSSDLMDTPLPLTSGDIEVKYRSGYDSSAGITVQQDVPLPMTILMIQVWINTYN